MADFISQVLAGLASKQQSDQLAFVNGAPIINPEFVSQSTGKLNLVQSSFLGALSGIEKLGLGGTQVKLYNDAIQRGRTASITETDLSPTEVNAFRRLVQGHSVARGQNSGNIDYKDYGEYAPDLTRNILGGFGYSINDAGDINITDKYDFNRSKADEFENNILMQALAGIVAPKNLAAQIGRQVRPDDGTGIPVSINIKAEQPEQSAAISSYLEKRSGKAQPAQFQPPVPLSKRINQMVDGLQWGDQWQGRMRLPLERKVNQMLGESVWPPLP